MMEGKRQLYLQQLYVSICNYTSISTQLFPYCIAQIIGTYYQQCITSCTVPDCFDYRFLSLGDCLVRYGMKEKKSVWMLNLGFVIIIPSSDFSGYLLQYLTAYILTIDL